MKTLFYAAALYVGIAAAPAAAPAAASGSNSAAGNNTCSNEERAVLDTLADEHTSNKAKGPVQKTKQMKTIVHGLLDDCKFDRTWTIQAIQDPNGPAATANPQPLQVGDRLTEVNGRSVASEKDTSYVFQTGPPFIIHFKREVMEPRSVKVARFCQPEVDAYLATLP